MRRRRNNHSPDPSASKELRKERNKRYRESRRQSQETNQLNMSVETPTSTHSTSQSIRSTLELNPIIHRQYHETDSSITFQGLFTHNNNTYPFFLTFFIYVFVYLSNVIAI